MSYLDKQIRERIFQDIGQASMCWKTIEKAGEFDSTKAKEIGENLCNYISDEIEKAQKRIIEIG